MHRRCRRGFGIAEVVVVLVIVAVVILLLVTAMPRRREAARLAGCRLNLREIGVAMVLTDRAQGRLPTVPPLGPETPPAMSGPLASMLQTLGLPSFAGLADPEQLPTNRPGAPLGPIRVPGFICPSDVNSGLQAPAMVSYRATTGGSVDGQGGVFAPGRAPLSLADVESADGQSYTAAFSERLIGNGRDVPDARNYALVPGPIAPEGDLVPAPESWRGDAGASWAVAGWSSTLYSHVSPPGGGPSYVTDDGQAARMGASSGHIEGVNVLRCDMSVTTVTPRIDPRIWRSLAVVNDGPGGAGPSLDDQIARQENPVP